MNIHKTMQVINLESIFVGGALSELAYRVFAGETDKLRESLGEDCEILQDVKKVLNVAQYSLDIQELDQAIEDFNEKYIEKWWRSRR